MSYIFIGNTSKKLNLTANKIYTDLPADKITELENRGLSLIKHLFIKPEKLNAAKAEIKQRGTVLNEALKQMNHIGG